MEIRTATPEYTQMEVGDTIYFVCGSHTVVRNIRGKTEYSTLKELLKTEGVQKCLPGATDIDEAMEFLNNLFTHSQRKNGYMAFHLENVKYSQNISNN